MWDEFGFHQERDGAEFHYASKTQLELALKLWDGHQGSPLETMREPEPDALMSVRNGSGEHLGWRLAPEVRRHA